MAPEATETTVSVDSSIAALRKSLVNEDTPLAQRFRALFSLKHVASQEPGPQASAAIESIAAAFASPSALLKHELAYCLGQTKNLEAVPFLRAVLENRSEDAMCRHEAAEALGALGDQSSLDLMKQIQKDETEPVVVRETCDIAVDRITWAHADTSKSESLRSSDFASIDPAPPMPSASDRPSISDLQSTLLDTSKSLFQRYRAMFTLRDLASPPDLPTAKPAVHALASGFQDPSALFRHEIAFVFGQLSHPESIPALLAVLENRTEEGMVRHEAAEALGSLGEEPGVEDMLRRFLDDPEQIVRESVIVALDMAEYEKSGEIEYATVPQVAVA
jgi:deoxyhypusine monooxygenase